MCFLSIAYDLIDFFLLFAARTSKESRGKKTTDVPRTIQLFGVLLSRVMSIS